MAASVLNTKRAAEVSVFIVRAFVALRQSVLEYTDIIKRLTDLENRTTTQDKDIAAIIQALRQLAEPEPVPKDGRIGFRNKSHNNCMNQPQMHSLEPE